MAGTNNSRGMIAVDKMGGKVLFLNPITYETEVVIDGFPRTVHELLVIAETGLAYVPIFGDGIHGRNPNPQHLVCVFDLHKRTHVATIDLRPYIAPHTLKLGPDGLIYITCENSAVVAVIDPKTNKVVEAIDSGSTNGHRLIIAPDGQRLYTENEEDGTVSTCRRESCSARSKRRARLQALRSRRTAAPSLRWMMQSRRCFSSTPKPAKSATKWSLRMCRRRRRLRATRRITA
jgi:DNA-binding beta-propeller fold protein YncE